MKDGERRVIGYAAVDSGQLIVVDPCYLREWKHGEYGDGADGGYDATCRATRHRDDATGEELDQGGEVLVCRVGGTAVAFSTGYGDGSYPVTAEYEDGRVKRITIDFFGDAEDEDEDEYEIP